MAQRVLAENRAHLISNPATV